MAKRYTYDVITSQCVGGRWIARAERAVVTIAVAFSVQPWESNERYYPNRTPRRL